MHPAIETIMVPYLNKFGRVQLNQILLAVNKTIKDLPTLSNYVKNGKTTLCYNAVLGCCSPQMCHMKAGHPPLNQITNEFAMELVTMLEPGVKYVFDNRSPRKRKQE